MPATSAMPLVISIFAKPAPRPQRTAMPFAAPLPSRGTESDFDAGPAADLLTAYLPLLDGITEKLQSGARVAHIACGTGQSLILLAMTYPNSQFLGFDNDTAAIAAASRAAEEAGVAHRVSLQVASAAEFARHQRYDLVILAQGLTALVHPNTIARHVRQTLKSTGTWVILEPHPPHPTADERRLREILTKAHFKHIQIAASTPGLQVIQARP